MSKLNKAAGIAIHLEGARKYRDDVGYFQAVQKNLKKYTLGGSGKSTEELNAAIRQIISGAVSSEYLGWSAAGGQLSSNRARFRRRKTSGSTGPKAKAVQQAPQQRQEKRLPGRVRTWRSGAGTGGP